MGIVSSVTALPRSFVRRERRSTQQNFPQKLWECYGINAQQPIEYTTIFKHTSSLTLEIGFGLGNSLFTQAQSNPSHNYIGIEVYKTGIKKLLYQLKTMPLDNLKIVEGDAALLLAHRTPTCTFDAIQILFPDPWPKRKHHKRRLIQPSFINLLYHVLKPNGTLYLTTDWEHYAKQMLNILEASPFINKAGQHQFAVKPPIIPTTKFEQRGQRLNHLIFYLVFTKC